RAAMRLTSPFLLTTMSILLLLRRCNCGWIRCGSLFRITRSGWCKDNLIRFRLSQLSQCSFLVSRGLCRSDLDADVLALEKLVDAREAALATQPALLVAAE